MFGVLFLRPIIENHFYTLDVSSSRQELRKIEKKIKTSQQLRFNSVMKKLNYIVATWKET